MTPKYNVVSVVNKYTWILPTAVEWWRPPGGVDEGPWILWDPIHATMVVGIRNPPPNRGFEVNFDAIGTFQPNVWKFEILCNAFGLIMTEVWWYALSFYKRWRSNRILVKWTHNFYPNNFTYGGLTLWRERFTFSIIKHWNIFLDK